MRTGNRTKPALTALLAALAAIALAAAGGATAGHTDPAGSPLPHATVEVWDTSAIGSSPNEAVDDVSGLTGQVGAPAIVTTFDTGIAFWNPDTNAFKWYRFGSDGPVDLNRSAPVASGLGRTFQPGDVWNARGGGLIVNFKGTGDFRIYHSEVSTSVKVDQSTGRVVYGAFLGRIGYLEPERTRETFWTVGGRPGHVALDAAGRIYATNEPLNEIERIDPATNELVRWQVPGAGSLGGGPAPNGITVDPNGNVWFAESGSNEIARLNPLTNEITEYTKAALTSPQLVSAAEAGGALQTYFAEGAGGTAVGVLTAQEAVGVTTAVSRATSTVLPFSEPVEFDDRTVVAQAATIVPQAFTVDGLDGGPDALGTTRTPAGERIPGILRFPLPPLGSTLSGLTGVFRQGEIAGSYSVGSRVFTLVSAAIPGPPAPPPPPPPPPDGPQHFKGYEVDKENPDFSGEDVLLTDAFGGETVHVGDARMLLTPVEKRRTGAAPEPVLRPEQHLKCYRVTGGRRLDETVYVSSQFALSAALLVKEPNRLCAPAVEGLDAPPAGPPADTQHYKCYRVEQMPRPLEEDVELIDRFIRETVTVRRAEQLCVPVTKQRAGMAAEPAPRPDELLVCYGIAERAPFAARTVFTRDQFGLQSIRVFDPSVLCVPSRRLLAPLGAPLPADPTSSLNAGGQPTFAVTLITPYAATRPGEVVRWRAQFQGGAFTGPNIFGPVIPAGVQLKVVRFTSATTVRVVEAGALHDPRPTLRQRFASYPFFDSEDSVVEFTDAGLDLRPGERIALTIRSDLGVRFFGLPLVAAGSTQLVQRDVELGEVVDLAAASTGTLPNQAPILDVDLAPT